MTCTTLSYNAFKWRAERTTAQMILLSLLMAALTGLTAQIRIPLPFTPVPITAQTFSVLLAGILLGKNWGGISQVLYAVLGAAGIPWFSGMLGGVAVLAGPTGGYILGFILCAFFLGHFSDKYVASRKLLPMLGLMFFSNFFIIFIPGLIQLALWLNIVKGESPSIMEILTMGFFPFLIGGVIKTLLAALVATGITPKKAFKNEIDAS